MGMIGIGRRESQEKCTVCEKTFPEDELELTPYSKTGKYPLLELLLIFSVLL